MTHRQGSLWQLLFRQPGIIIRTPRDIIVLQFSHQEPSGHIACERLGIIGLFHHHIRFGPVDNDFGNTEMERAAAGRLIGDHQGAFGEERFVASRDGFIE